MTKTCTKCKQVKPLSLFYYRKDRSSYRPRCKECSKQETIAKTPSEKAKRSRVFKDRYHNDATGYRSANIDAKYRGRYNISSVERERMLTDQSYKCKICGVHQDSLKKSLAVDHNHKTGVIRGLLCDHCNRGLGFFRESIIALANAIEYLKHEGKHEKEDRVSR